MIRKFKLNNLNKNKKFNKRKIVLLKLLNFVLNKRKIEGKDKKKMLYLFN